MEQLFSQLPMVASRDVLRTDIFAARLSSSEARSLIFYTVDDYERVWFTKKAKDNPEETGLCYFDTESKTSILKWKGEVSSLVSGKDGRIFILPRNESWIGSIDGPDGEIKQWNPSPSDWPVSIGAASDGTMFFYSNSGILYRYRDGDKDWVPMPKPPSRLKQFSASSGNVVWAIADGGEDGDELIWFRNGSWKPISGELRGTTNVAACEDGRAFLVRCISRGDDDFALIVSRMDTHGEETELYRESTKSIILPGAVCTHSNRVYFRRMYEGYRGFELQAFTVGIADLPAKGWDPFSAEEEKAYKDISLRLKLGPKELLRDIYDLDRAWSVYIDDIKELNPPSDIAREDWETVRDLLLGELKAVEELQKLVGRIRQVYTKCEIKCIEAFDSVKPYFRDVFKKPHQELDMPIGLLVDKGINSIVRKLPSPYSVVGSLLAGPLSKAISNWLGTLSSGLDPDIALGIEAAKLEVTYSELFDRASRSLSEAKSKIVSSGVKLKASQAAIRGGDWNWPSKDAEDITSGALLGFSRSIFQSLAPVMWKVLVFEDWDINRASPKPVTKEPEAPDWAIYSDSKKSPYYDGWLQVTYWVLCGVGSSTHPYKMNPFPGKDFMGALSKVGYELKDVALGYDGWARPGFHRKGDKQPEPHAPY